MKALGRELQRQRIAKALPFVEPGSKVLDIGCSDGAFFAAAGAMVAGGVGIDLQQPDSWVGEPHELRVGAFPDVLHPGETFDAIVALAVVEHVPEDDLAVWAKAVFASDALVLDVRRRFQLGLNHLFVFRTA